MKLGITLITIGGLVLGANLLASLQLASIGEGVIYIFTGLALPGLLLFFGIRRLRNANRKVKREKPTD